MKDVDGVRKAVMKPARAHWRDCAVTRQRGASLLEAIAYLGIAALVVIGAIALLTSAFSSANTNAVSEQISAIQTGVKKLYSGQNASYTGLTNPVLASAGVFPASISPASDGTVTNTWNGTVVVAVAASPDQFTITYTEVPQSVCVNAVSGGGSWTAISVNGTALTLPVTPAAASGACTTGANTIIWTST
jgi:hypothetical protein